MSSMRLLRRLFWWTLAALALLAVAVWVAQRLSPWPGVWLLRGLFEQGGVQTATALQPLVPAGVTSVLDEPYGTDARGAVLRLDVYRPAAASASGNKPLPTVLWVHGGGFVAGRKEHVREYLQILAAGGELTTVAMSYGRAPESPYPRALHDINAALAHVLAHAERLGVDRERIFVAGDSAGAQMAAQLAHAISEPAHARALDLQPAIERRQLRGALLFCGPHDLTAFNFDRGPIAPLLRSVMWSLFGSADFRSDPRLLEASIAHQASAAFAPAFISVGNADPLARQSRALAARLQGLGVPVQTLFFADDHQPALGHEYQFNLGAEAGGSEAREALEALLEFLRESGKSSSG